MRSTRSSGPEPASHHLRAFGLEVRCEFPLTGSRVQAGPELSLNGSGEQTGSPPATVIRRLPSSDFDAAWKEPGERVFSPAFPDGRARFTVDRTSRQYRLWLEDFGRYLIAADGSRIDCEEEAVPPAVRERFIFAQALPVASALHGFSVLHASAVCGPEGAAAFLGPSGSGKTGLATRMVLRGAGLVTDDVLALEAGPDTATAYPGPPFMALRPDDAALVERADVRLGAPVGASDKLHLERPTPERPLPLCAVYHLRRGAAAGIRPLDAEARHLVLGHAFVPYVMTPARLLRHLELAQVISSRVDQFELELPPDGPNPAAMDLLAAQLRERGTA